MSLYKMPVRNSRIARVLIKCMALRLKLTGLFGSFFLKKYITQMYIINKNLYERQR